MASIEERLQRLEESMAAVHQKLDRILPKVQVMEDHVGAVERVAQRVPLVRRLFGDSKIRALTQSDEVRSL